MGKSKMDEDSIESKVTLVGEKISNVGSEFIFMGSTPECEKCNFSNTCMNLSESRKYRVVARKKEDVRECTLHEEGVVAVDVIESPLIIAVESAKAFEGSSMNFSPIECKKRRCSMYRVCKPEGLEEGEKFKIDNVVGDMIIDCEEEKDLKIVEAKLIS